MPLCRMCHQDRLLIKAHILPEGLYPHRMAGSADTRIYSNIPNLYPRRSPMGVYDTGILCRECEDLFQECDDYAIQVLRAKPNDTGGGEGFFELQNFNYNVLKRFFMAVLWRAAVSSHDMFNNVDVGAGHEQRLRGILQSNIVTDPEEYAAWLTTFDDAESAGVVLPPLHVKFQGVHIYRFVIAGFTLWVKADQRNTPAPFDQFILRPNEPCRVLVRPWRTSREWQEIMLVVATATEA